jgi:hypothetical protein
VSALAQDAELLQKLKQVEENAWLLFSELPPCAARTRALHVFLDAKDLKARLERLRQSRAASEIPLAVD